MFAMIAESAHPCDIRGCRNVIGIKQQDKVSAYVLLELYVLELDMKQTLMQFFEDEKWIARCCHMLVRLGL